MSSAITQRIEPARKVLALGGSLAAAAEVGMSRADLDIALWKYGAALGLGHRRPGKRTAA